MTSPASQRDAVDQVVAVDEADAGAGEVELVLPVDAGQLGGLAADQHAAGGAADLGGALDELGDLVELDVRGGDVVEQEERRRAGAEDVVDAVRGEIHAAPAKAARAPLQHELRADAVGRRGEEAPLVERDRGPRSARSRRRRSTRRPRAAARRRRSRSRARRRRRRRCARGSATAHSTIRPRWTKPAGPEPRPFRLRHDFVTTCSCLTPGQVPPGQPLRSTMRSRPAVSDTGRCPDRTSSRG